MSESPSANSPEAIGADGTTPSTSSDNTDRRSLITKGVLAAAVGAVAGTTLSRSASAANGDTINVGQARTGTLTTRLSGGTTFEVTDGESAGSASIYGQQAGGTAGDYGVRGRHSGSQGVGVYGDVSGSSGIGVHGYSTGSAGTGVYGQHLGDTLSGTGVLGRSDRGTGVNGIGTTADLRASGVGRIGVAAGAAITPTTTGGNGLLGRDDADGLWWSPSSGVWRKLASSSTAGAFHAVTPFRVFDSRRSGFAGILTAPTNRTASVADAIDPVTGSVTTSDATPEGAIAIAANITIVQTTGGGFVAVNPGGTAAVTASHINWSDGGVAANGGIFQLNSSREIELVVGGQAGSQVHVIVDITGYWL